MTIKEIIEVSMWGKKHLTGCNLSVMKKTNVGLHSFELIEIKALKLNCFFFIARNFFADFDTDTILWWDGGILAFSQIEIAKSNNAHIKWRNKCFWTQLCTVCTYDWQKYMQKKSKQLFFRMELYCVSPSIKNQVDLPDAAVVVVRNWPKIRCFLLECKLRL